MENQVTINGEVFNATQLRISDSVPTKMMFEDLFVKVDLIFTEEGSSGKAFVVTIGQFPLTNPNNTGAAIKISHTEAIEFANNFAVSIRDTFDKRYSIVLPISK